MTPDSIEVALAGPSAPVEVRIDRAGIPHIRAADEDDLFFAQGYVVARDRLFQLDLWRRRGLGRLAEVFGAEYVARDRAARLFLYRGDMRAEWLAYGDGVQRIATRFVAGINARIAECLREKTLPPEFGALGYEPEEWRPEDVAVIRSHGLFGNLRDEVRRAVVLRDHGPDVEDVRRRREPEIDLVVPDGLDLADLSEDVLETYLLATAPFQWPGGAPLEPREPDGSNNWALSGSLTASGRPILASDPHRAMSLPSLRYITHLECPTLSAIGAGEPALPGVSVGHNGHIAFGFTIFPIDQEDLYVYTLHPDDDDRYLYRGGWVAFRTEHETVAVRDAAPVDIDLRFTVHGPLIHVDRARRRAFAVRAAWLEPGMAPYLGSVGLLRARTADEFTTAMDRWGSPGENQVYATVDGVVGWKAAGVVPIRPNWDGLLPVPGDGRYEWAGFRTGGELPGTIDPAAGFVASANQMNLPADGSWTPVPISYEWYAEHRQRRIEAVLAQRHDWDLRGTRELQNDYLSGPALEVIALLDGLDLRDADAVEGRRILAAWDGAMLATSGPAALFERWFRGSLADRLVRDLLDRDGSGGDVEAGVRRVLPDETPAGDPRPVLTLLSRAAATGEDGRRTIEDTLAAATRSWRADGSPVWGAVHRSRLTHPLSGAPGLGPLVVGDRPKNGSADTVGVASWGPSGTQTAGASFRLVVDVGSWDESVVINTPGQSGDPRSPHFADLYDAWLADDYVPLPFSEGAVAAATELVITITPAAAG